MKIDIRTPEVAYIQVNDFTVYIDDSTGERIVELIPDESVKHSRVPDDSHRATTSILAELHDFIHDMIREGEFDEEDDCPACWHLRAFEEYYIIEYVQAEGWLKKHGISLLEAAALCRRYEKHFFGYANIYESPDLLVSHLAKVMGIQVINDIFKIDNTTFK